MNLLLTSVGRRTYMIKYFKSALQGKGKVFASNSIYTYTLKEADEFVLSPQIYDEEYVNFLIKYCKEKNISAIISLFDIDLPILSKNKALFDKENIKLIVSDYKVTQICNDKWETYKFLKGIGLKQPATFISINEVKRELSDGKLQFPLFIKPRWGMGSIGIYKIDNAEEFDVLYRKLHDEIFNTYLRFESSLVPDSCILIQQSIKGQEYGVEVLNDLDGNYISTFAKVKIAMRAGETDIAETVSSDPFEKTAGKISKNLKHVGILDMDCFMTEKGDLYVLEMNCRFGGQYPFTHNAGVNIPAQLVSWLKGDKTNFDFLKQKNGVRSCKDLVPVII